MDKNWGKDVFHTIKTAFGYPPKSAWHKISYLNFCKLTQITKTLIVLRQIVPPFDIIFGDNIDDVIDDANNNLVQRIM